MKALLVFGTTEGQTEKVTRFIADILIREGHQVSTAAADRAQSTPDPGEFDAVLIAASLHAGRYQPAVARFIREHLPAITARANAFVSVSLAAASGDPEDRSGLTRCVSEFLRESGWKPDRIHHVAGAFRYTQYDFLKRWAMKYIAWRRGAPTDTGRDYELTDWDDVTRFGRSFAAEAVAPPERLTPQPVDPDRRPPA